MDKLLYIALAASLLVLVLYHLHIRRMLKKIDRSLDQAIGGKMDVTQFDESQSSKLEAKLARYLVSAKLRREDLTEAQDKTRELISDISHQTKTPLSNIILSTQLLAEQPELTADSQQLVAQVDKNAEKLSFLIQSLVKLSRLESGTIQVLPVRTNLYELAQSCLESCRRDAEIKNITLTLQKPEAEVHALCDFKWCGEALSNILDNAIKYTSEKGQIEISILSYQMFACIQVRDTGRGISEEDLPKIFGRFYRSTSSSQEAGVGIGLYLAREIIQRCGGYIQASSSPMGGSTFSVYLSKL